MSGIKLITDHLDLWTGAVTSRSTAGRGRSGKIELTGIKKLRELILELAVRGKLVEQDPNDEPASVLLERIAEEKASLVKEGKIKKPKKLPEITEDERPFELPEGWAWFRIGDYLEFQYGKALAAKDRNDSGDIDVYGSNGVVGKHDEALTTAPCIIIGRKGSAGALNKALAPSWTTDVSYYLLPPENISFDYCYLLLRSLKLDKLGKGIKPGVNRNEAYFLVAALPPLEEQHRIIEKVDELMALCDRLEQQVGDQLEAHEVLVDTLLGSLFKPAEGSLTRSADACEVAENWARIAEHFDTLFTTEASIDKLKQTILQLAVMGRLAEQDPNDEPANVLLEKIAEEKARLVKEGKIKKPKKLPDIESDECSFQAHSNWKWVRFQDIANEISTGPFGSMIHKHDYVDNGVPLINPSHMINGEIQEDRSISVPASKAEELSSYKLGAGDIVMARRGEVGRCAVVTNSEAGWLCGTGSFALRFHDSLSRRFILMMFATNQVRGYLTGNSVGTTMTNLNHGILNRMPVALPPATEQHRIVEKVEELMTLCDQLKARLGEAGETRTHLAEAVVEQAVVEQAVS